MRFETTYFNTPLKYPLIIGTKEITHREGFYLHATLNDKSGTGEAAPLPGVHHETISQIAKELQKPFDSLVTSKYPSVRFAAESVLLELKDTPSLPLQGEIKCNHLCYLGREVPNAEVLKIKVGIHSLSKEKQEIEKIITSTNSILRIDGNRRLTPEILSEIISDIPVNRIEYLEEPFHNLAKWNYFYHEHKIKVALDESLIETNDFSKIEGIAAFVIKPTLHGITKSISLIDQAHALGVSAVISSTFDTLTAMKTHKRLALYSDRYKPTYHGLMTTRFLA